MLSNKASLQPCFNTDDLLARTLRMLYKERAGDAEILLLLLEKLHNRTFRNVRHERFVRCWHRYFDKAGKHSIKHCIFLFDTTRDKLPYAANFQYINFRKEMIIGQNFELFVSSREKLAFDDVHNVVSNAFKSYRL